MAESDFLPFAVGDGANVIDQPTYVAAETTWVASGFEVGTAISDQLNKVWRQSSFVAAGVAGMMLNVLNINILDDGNLTEFVTNLITTVEVLSGIKSGRLFLSSATLVITTGDYTVGVQRSAPTANQVIQLPTPTINQEFQVQDVMGNFGAFPPLLTPPTGHSIAGLPVNAAWPLNVDRGSWIVHYYGNSTWGIARCAS